MQHEISRHTHHSFVVTVLVHRSLHFGMLAYKIVHLLESNTRTIEHRFHLVLGADLRFAQRHLDAAVCIHVTFT